MISEEAVEAAARVFYHLQPNGTPLIREREQARAALEAALPHLLAGKAEEIARVIAEDTVKSWDWRDDAEEGAYETAVAEEAAFNMPTANRIISTVCAPAHPQKGGEG